MVDLVVRGDRVVTPEGPGAHDVLIEGERIVALRPAGGGVPEGARLIDATGKIVMPGGIDPHVHCKWPLPNPDGSWGETDPPEVVSRAALHGGTTTIIDFTRTSQGDSVADAIERRERDWRGRCACDYA
jgi:dihydropyrimidinase